MPKGALEARMIPCSILVPLARNDGRPQPRKLFRQLEDELIERFGGFTDAGLKGGGWRDDDGVVYRDRSRQYDIAVTTWKDVPGFLQIAESVATRFGQLAVFITIAGIPDILPGPAP